MAKRFLQPTKSNRTVVFILRESWPIQKQKIQLNLFISFVLLLSRVVGRGISKSITIGEIAPLWAGEPEAGKVEG